MAVMMSGLDAQRYSGSSRYITGAGWLAPSTHPPLTALHPSDTLLSTPTLSTVSVTSNHPSAIPQPHIEDDIWGTKSIVIEAVLPPTETSWAELPLEVSPPPGLPIPHHLLATPELMRSKAPRPSSKPKGPRPQPSKIMLEPFESQSSSSSEEDEPTISATLPPRRTRGIYGDRPRLPTRRPSRYIPEYTCDGDRFAHLAPFQNQQELVIDRHVSVSLATMGLERFSMNVEETEYMDLEVEAELFRSLDAAVERLSTPRSSSAVQLSFVANGLRGALSNFRARFEAGAGNGADRKWLNEQESDIETVVEGGYVDVGQDEIYPRWMVL
ncbi:hypothetical protein FRC07_007994 [Ceratobasidium sp. 392]|nr:hypothetical protein FRC07_007994 [Ceratobasidium sp. 392]